MLNKIFVVILTVLITVSAFSAYGRVISGCSEQSCCCSGMAMTGKVEAGQTDKYLKIESAKACCCGGVTGSTCSLMMVVPLEKIGWAFSSNRIDPFFSTLSAIMSTVDVDNYSQLTFRLEITSNEPHPGSPPIYLSSMSFLC